MKISLPGREDAPCLSKILCIGRNYADHAAEMGSDVPDEPMVFLKPPSAVVRSGEAVRVPPQSSNVHHEVELVAAIGQGGADISVDRALDHVAAYAVGLDMTARDVQQAAKQRRHPWSVAKGFDTFAPLGAFVPARLVVDPQQLRIECVVNGTTRQAASTDAMIFSVAELVAYCSTIFTLTPGDLIYTGTPEGVGPVVPGDSITATISNLPSLEVSVRRR